MAFNFGAFASGFSESVAEGIKDNDISTETSRQSNMMTYYALGVISVLAVGVILYSIQRSRNPKEE